MKKGKFTLSLAIGLALTLITISAITIFIFDGQDKAYGKNYSFLFSLIFITIIVAVTGITSVLGVELSKGYLPASHGYIAGSLFAVVILFSWFLIERTTLENNTKHILLLSILIIGGLLMPMLTSRLSANKNG